MQNVAKLSSDELKELFALTANEMRLVPAIVEKDFWVVWMLDYLFSRSPWRPPAGVQGRDKPFKGVRTHLTVF